MNPAYRTGIQASPGGFVPGGRESGTKSGLRAFRLMVEGLGDSSVQWQLHIKASAAAARFMWRYQASRKQWATAIAVRAVHGQADPSTLLVSGSPRRSE